MPLLFQLIAKGGCAAVLPNNGIVNRFAANPVPYNGCFALIGDAYSLQICAVNTHLNGCLCRYTCLACPDFVRVMLNPARLRKYLLKLFLGNRFNLPLMIKNDGPRAGGALV